MIDLNLLRVFDTLMEERSVTRAGDRLGLSQSAISHALNRLRYELKDELFTRGSEGMQPTPQAREIAPGLRQGLLQLQAALHSTQFVPERTTRRFTIAGGSYTSSVLMPELVAQLRRQAPQAELRIQPSELGVAEALDAGRIDIAVGTSGHIPDRFESEVLFEDTVVWAIGASHPFAQAPLTLERLAELPHVILSTIVEDKHVIDGASRENGLERLVTRDDEDALVDAFAAKGLHRVIGLTVPYPYAALAIVGRSGMAALLPRRIVAAIGDAFNVKLFEPPYPSPSFEIRALWHRNHGAQPAIQWLRGLLRDVASHI